MNWFARLNTTSPAHMLWRRKGIRPYSLLNVPFHWDGASHTYVTNELDRYEVARLMDSSDVRLEVIRESGPVEIKVEVLESGPVEIKVDLPVDPVEDIPPSPETTDEEKIPEEKIPLERKRGRPAKSIL